MSVSSVNFKSSVGCTPLRKDNNVSFARRQEETGKTEAPKSHKGAYITAGVGLAAAVAAGIAFRKPIGNFIKSLKLPSMANLKNKAHNAAESLKGGFEKSTTFVKEKGAEAVKNIKDKFKNFNVSNNVAGAFSNVKTKTVKIAKFVFKKVVEGAKFVKDFVVSLWQKAVALFSKAAHKA